jgi:hypothetical protein
MYRKGKTFSLLVAVVDDLLLATNNIGHSEEFKTGMDSIFDLKAMGPPKYMIGMHLTKKKNKLHISQRQYIHDMAVRHSKLLESASPATTPALPSTQLVKTGQHGSPDSPAVDSKCYRSLVGALMYACVTRPDIGTSVSMCARFLAAPTKVHLDQAVRILAYLVHTVKLDLVYSCSPTPVLRTYVDASWGAEKDTRRSRFGFAVYYGRALIS